MLTMYPVLIRHYIAVVILSCVPSIVQTLTLVAPCVNCEELNVKLGQNAQTVKKGSIVMEELAVLRCPGECRCPSVYPKCQDGVPVVMDGCGCCPVCARQQGDVCNGVHLCDTTRKLDCVYADPFHTSGICRVRRGQGCRVGETNYKDGDTFKLDCRTQCTCQNGTYGCVSLCPHENVRPSAKCHRPQLVKMHGSCCREWLCESTLYEDRKAHCQHYTSEWSPCSTTCGTGVSSRVSNDNPECQLKNETRLCLIRPCDVDFLAMTHGHHVRKHHVCRATLRSHKPISLTDSSNCTSVDLLQPKYCGYCTDRHCCHPKITTNKKIQFRCTDEDGTYILQKEVLWVLKCDCSSVC